MYMYFSRQGLPKLRKNMPTTGFIKELILIVPHGEDVVFQNTLATADPDSSIAPSIPVGDGTVTGPYADQIQADQIQAGNHHASATAELFWMHPGLCGGSDSLQLLRPSYESPWPIRILPERLALNMSLPEFELAKPHIHFYKLQMLLKLWVSQWVTTRFYLVLDSDVLMVRSLVVGSDGVGALFPEGTSSGRAIYQPQPRTLHAQWWSDSEVRLVGNQTCVQVWV
ncbi:MAG: hypothetical protein WDW36_002990 [Sanguina aurantia]